MITVMKYRKTIFGIFMIFGMAAYPLSAEAAYFPFGHPDIEILLGRPSYVPVELTNENFDVLLDDVKKVPDILNRTILPNVKDVILENEGILLNQYVEDVSVIYDMDLDKIYIEIVTIPGQFPDKTIDLEQDPNMEETSLIRQISILMPVYWNSSRPDLLSATVSKLEELNSQRAAILSTHATEVLQGHQAEFFGDGNSTTISFISMKMLDRELSRVTVFNPDDDSGIRNKVIDDVKVTGAFVVPEFPAVLVLTLVMIGLIGATAVIRRMKAVDFKYKSGSAK